jgi:hypothetical protein
MSEPLDGDAQGSLLSRIAATDDIAPAVRRAASVPVTIGGRTYDGIMAVPIAELALCSAADYKAMRHAHRSHRSRRLRAAAEDGTLSAAEVEALQKKGVLPSNL